MQRSQRITRQSGWSLVEIVSATAILLLSMAGLSSMFLSTVRLGEQKIENVLLGIATSNLAETLKESEFSLLAQEYGPGSGKENFWFQEDGTVTFSDPGDAWATGHIELFNDEASIPATFADLSSGFDLNGNGETDSALSDDYKILPVRLTVKIASTATPRIVTLEWLLKPTKSW